MSILQCLLILSALASLLVTGPNLVPVQSYAVVDNESTDNYKDIKEINNDIKEINNDIQKKSKPGNTNQNLDQDNLCNRDDGCEQANEGEQVKGKDNKVLGFNDQSKNIPQQPVVTNPPTPTTSTLTVNKDVVCNFTSTVADCPAADLFNITATTGNGSSISFNGSESGTP